MSGNFALSHNQLFSVKWRKCLFSLAAYMNIVYDNALSFLYFNDKDDCVDEN